MDSSDDEPAGLPSAGPKPRRNRHKFQTFAQRVNEVRIGSCSRRHGTEFDSHRRRRRLQLPPAAPRAALPLGRHSAQPPCHPSRSCPNPPTHTNTHNPQTTQVEVDVFRRGQRVRTQPLPGSESWTQEALSQWRELCSAPDWLDAAAEVNQLVQTLPLLVHHRETVSDGVLCECVKRLRERRALWGALG
jgi:hypothetical protein